MKSPTINESAEIGVMFRGLRILVPERLVLKRESTLEEWEAGRRLRRDISDLISPNECGKDTSDDDDLLRARYNGRRNLPFEKTEDIPGITLRECLITSAQAAEEKLSAENGE